VDACFGASFEDGDCDRDLVPNRSDGTLCEGVLITIDVEIGSAPVGAGLRRDPSAGSREVAPGVWSDVPNAVAIGCTAVDRCPMLPGLASRCVFPYPALQGGRLGLCTYGRDTRNDRTCIDAPEVPGTGCLFSGGVPSATGYSDWARGDCDGDGLPNEQDSQVCGVLQVIGPAPGSDLALVCAPGVVTRPDRVACSSARQLAPGIVGCASERSGADTILPFAICCGGQAECPVLSDGTVARCVRIPSASPRGVCTYGPGTTPRDDLSCLESARPIATECFLGSPGEYDSWARGDCDECRPSNGDDDAVCACPAEDAGTDSGARALDAAVAYVEAGTGPLDAGTLDVRSQDASSPAPPLRRSGCGCAAAEHTPPLSWCALAALACGLGARRARVRRRRAERARAASVLR
jgi:hypothetical protein